MHSTLLAMTHNTNLFDTLTLINDEKVHETKVEIKSCMPLVKQPLERKYYEPHVFKLYCANCGKKGHSFNNCRDPITSIGIICFKIDNIDYKSVKEIFGNLMVDNQDKSHDYVQLKYVPGIQLNTLLASEKKADVVIKDMTVNISEELIKNFLKYKDNIKFLLVQRKYSLGYIVFMKGKWKIDDKEELITLFSQMTKEEIDGLKSCVSIIDFKQLWDAFWIYNNDKGIVNYQLKREREYNNIKHKIDILMNQTSWNLEYYCRIVHVDGNIPEWGFPKGKRQNRETNIKCAVREFVEETGVKTETFSLLNRVKEMKEDMIGTNMQKYRHLYYISYVDNSITLKHDPSHVSAHRSEIGNIAWFNYMDAISIINPKHEEKKQILTQIYLFIVNRLMSKIT